MVAGSNPVSPTEFVQLKCYFYLLPKLTAREHLIRVKDGREPPHLIFGANTGLNCGFCPEFEARTAGREFSASCDTQIG